MVFEGEELPGPWRSCAFWYLGKKIAPAAFGMVGMVSGDAVCTQLGVDFKIVHVWRSIRWENPSIMEENAKGVQKLSVAGVPNRRVVIMRRATSRLRRKGNRKVDETSARRPAEKRKHRRATKLSEALVLVGGIVACAFLNVLGGTIFMAIVNRSSPDVSLEGSEAHESPEQAVDPLAFQRFSRNAPPCHPISADEVDFTLVSQLSLDRIWMMEHHCQRWGGNSHMSIAILTNETRQQTLARLESMGCDLDSITLQTLRLEPSFSTDYPVNRLRNLALSAVETSHVMLVDVDFWEARNLRDILYLPEVVDALVNDSKLALVIPAFQLIRQCREYRDCREKNIPKMPFSKNDMVELMLGRKGSPFDPTNRGGHFSTMYLLWADQEDGELQDLPCIRSNRYEPYMAFRYCQDLPPFQEAFTGYGKNKMTVCVLPIYVCMLANLLTCFRWLCRCAGLATNSHSWAVPS